MLIKCPECGKEISDESKQCVHCGFPIARYLNQQREKEYIEQNPNGQPKAYKVFNIIQFVSCIILLLFILAFIVVYAFTSGNPFKDDILPLTVFIISEIVGIAIDIIVCGILKACFRRK